MHDAEFPTREQVHSSALTSSAQDVRHVAVKLQACDDEILRTTRRLNGSRSATERSQLDARVRHLLQTKSQLEKTLSDTRRAVTETHERLRETRTAAASLARSQIPEQTHLNMSISAQRMCASARGS